MEIPQIARISRDVTGSTLQTAGIFFRTPLLILFTRLVAPERINQRTVRLQLISSVTFVLCAAGMAVVFFVQAILWGGFFVPLGAINGFDHAISLSIDAFTTYGGSGIVSA